MSKYTIRIRVLGDRIVASIDKMPLSKFTMADLLPWAAIFISIASLLFSINQGMEAREHDRLSLMPYLHMAFFGESKLKFGIRVENNGVGPAIIDKIVITYDNKEIESVSKLYEEIVKLIPNIENGSLSYTEISSGQYYKVGSDVHLIEGLDMNLQTHEAVWSAMKTKLEIKLFYCSAYKQCRVECLIADKADCDKE